MTQFVWNKQATWIYCCPFNFNWARWPMQEAKAPLLCCRLWTVCGSSRVLALFNASSVHEPLKNPWLQLYKDCKQAFKSWAKEKWKYLSRIQKDSKGNKRKKTIFRCTSIQEHHQGKDNTPYCLSGRRPEKLWLSFWDSWVIFFLW